MDIAPAKSISMPSADILGDPPHIPRRMTVQCSLLYHSISMVLLWCVGQHMDLQSFRL